jgi:tRNA threonylcarbamoyladenosine biosynthesis protein TsaE
MQKRSTSGEELQEIAREFALSLVPSSTATIVTLSGELGAGKTTFTQGLAAALGVKEPVTSPTFVIEKIYGLDNQVFERLIHIDAYRLKGAEELKVLGFDELLADEGSLVLIEWPEKILAAVPESATRIRFDIDGDARIITINAQETNSESSSESGKIG